jgi:hypothetical protein
MLQPKRPCQQHCGALSPRFSHPPRRSSGRCCASWRQSRPPCTASARSVRFPSSYDAIVNLHDQLAHDAPGSLVRGQSAVEYDILQAAVAPLVLVATAALSFGASFGLSTLIWRYGLGYQGMVHYDGGRTVGPQFTRSQGPAPTLSHWRCALFRRSRRSETSCKKTASA